MPQHWTTRPRIDLTGLEELRSPYHFIDCQAFAGGFSCAMALAGFQLVGKLENVGGFGVPILEANRAFLGDAWKAQVGKPETWEPMHADVIVGTPPCTAFSNMSVGTSVRGIGSSVEHCMWDLVEYAAKVKPAALIMESVGGAFTAGRSLMRQLAEHLNELTGLAYRTTHVMQNNLSTGGCTNRRRYFLVLSQVPFGVEHYPLRWLPTVGDAIGDLANLRLTWESQPLTSSPTWWSRDLRTVDHVADGHMDVTTKHVPRLLDLVTGDAGVPWEDGEREADVLQRFYRKNGYLPESWHYEFKGRVEDKTAPRPTRANQLLSRNLDPGGFNQLRKWDWDQPGHVISGAGPFMLWHRDNRHMTHREVARFMGFPDDWLVGTAASEKLLHAYWGKGTSVHPARWVGEWMRHSLDGEPGSVEGELLDDGSRLIDVSNDWRPLARRMWGSVKPRRQRTEDAEVVEFPVAA